MSNVISSFNNDPELSQHILEMAAALRLCEEPLKRAGVLSAEVFDKLPSIEMLHAALSPKDDSNRVLNLLTEDDARAYVLMKSFYPWHRHVLSANASDQPRPPGEPSLLKYRAMLSGDIICESGESKGVAAVAAGSALHFSRVK
jgi:hypothetical protein